MNDPTPRRKAFTLIELLTVLGVLGVLVAIFVPIFGKVRASAHQADSISNLRQLSSIYLLYTQEKKGKLLQASDGVTNGKYWQLYLQEFMEADSELRQMRDFTSKACLAANPGLEGGDGVVRSTYGLNNYIGRGGVNPGDNSTWGINYIIQAVAPDRTVLFGDPAMESDRYTMVGIGYEDNLFPTSYHPAGLINLSFLDGHVESRLAADIPTSATVYPKGRDGSIFWRGW